MDELLSLQTKLALATCDTVHGAKENQIFL